MQILRIPLFLAFALAIALSAYAAASGRPRGSGQNGNEMSSSATACPNGTDADLAISEEVREHYDAALEYLEAERPGLAVAEIAQARAAAPCWLAARDAEDEIQAAANASVRAQEQAIREVARADAARAAEVAREAAERAAELARQEAARAAAQEAEARRLEAQRLETRIASYVRTAPQGSWSADAAGIMVGVTGFGYRSETGRFTQAPAGFRFVTMGIGIFNASTQDIHVNPLNVTLVDHKGASYRYHSSTHSWCAAPLAAVDVRPSNHAAGCLVFLVDASTGPAKILYRTASIRGTDVVVDLEREPDER